MLRVGQMSLHGGPMRRWVVLIVGLGALVVMLMGLRAFQRMAAQKTCSFDATRQWNAAAQTCEPRP